MINCRCQTYIKGYNIGDSTVIRLSGSNAVETPMLVATTMPNKTHTQIYLQFLNEYKQLTAYELLILKKLFDERLKYFNHENDYLISYSELAKGGDLITNRSLPNPAEISVKDGKAIKTHLQKNAKVIFNLSINCAI